MQVIFIEIIAMLIAEIIFILIFKKTKSYDSMSYIIGFLFRMVTILVLIVIDAMETKNLTVELILIANTLGQMLVQTYLPALKKHRTQAGFDTSNDIEIKDAKEEVVPDRKYKDDIDQVIGDK